MKYTIIFSRNAVLLMSIFITWPSLIMPMERLRQIVAQNSSGFAVGTLTGAAAAAFYYRKMCNQQPENPLIFVVPVSQSVVPQKKYPEITTLFNEVNASYDGRTVFEDYRTQRRDFRAGLFDEIEIKNNMPGYTKIYEIEQSEMISVSLYRGVMGRGFRWESLEPSIEDSKKVLTIKSPVVIKLGCECIGVEISLPKGAKDTLQISVWDKYGLRYKKYACQK